MKKKKTAEKYNRIAKFYDLLTKGHEEKYFSKWKKKFFSPLKGKILEVGIGTGKNIEYYNKDAEVIGIDFSKEMLNRARKKLSKTKRRNIKLRQMNVENLKFKDNSFDYVVTSCVFCSVPDSVKGLKEIRRVLKPTGRLIMIEHVLSENFFLALIEHINNPISRLIFGVNINRNIKQNIIDAGMKIKEERNLALYDIFKKFVAVK